MYLHNTFFVFCDCSVGFFLLVGLMSAAWRLGRGEIGLLRLSLLICAGTGLILAGMLMLGGPHGKAGSLIEWFGGLVLVIAALTASRFRQSRKVGKPSA